MREHRYEAARAPEFSLRRTDPDLDSFDRLVDQVLDVGGSTLRLLDRLDPAGQEQVQRLVQRGLLGRSDQGEYQLTAAGLKRCEESALRELLAGGTSGGPGRHATQPGPSAGTPDASGTRPYRDGDSLGQLEVGETVRRAAHRQNGRRPLRLAPDDLVVLEEEGNTRCRTILLLDRSGSMGLYGKFLFAKRLALGLRALIRERFPGDRLTVVGFGTRASVLSEPDLLLARPYSVGLLDNRRAVRVGRGEARDGVPEHFTNLQAGLKLARKLLASQSGENRQILCLTDGEPTAHEEADELVMAYPPSRETADATVREVIRCRQAGVAMGFFALVDSPLIGQLPAFVERLARAGKGAAAYFSAGTSARLVLDRFRAGRFARQHLG
jgi:uncharacterized protein with von Willebrand factor type A (vWA) domain